MAEMLDYPTPRSSGGAEAVATFVAERPRLFGIAYRMLGSVTEAEDVVQDAWLRWQGADSAVVVNPSAYLTTVTTRLAINASQSARARRERYVGPWLPEPVDTSLDPNLGATSEEALELAALVLLEKLTPIERAVYVLREAFDYPFRQIADILQITEANARQIVVRARRHVADGRRTAVNATEQRRFLDAFLAAAQRGNAAELEELFAEDIVSYSDGGGIRGVARKPVVGRTTVAKFTTLIRSRLWVGTTFRVIEANGQSCALVLRGGVPFGLGTVRASAPGIDQVMWMMNPSKIASIVGGNPRA